MSFQDLFTGRNDKGAYLNESIAIEAFKLKAQEFPEWPVGMTESETRQ